MDPMAEDIQDFLNSCPSGHVVRTSSTILRFQTMWHWHFWVSLCRLFTFGYTIWNPGFYVSSFTGTLVLAPAAENADSTFGERAGVFNWHSEIIGWRHVWDCTVLCWAKWCWLWIPFTHESLYPDDSSRPAINKSKVAWIMFCYLFVLQLSDITMFLE